MKGILVGALAVMAALVGAVVYVVLSQAGASYHAAVDHCHDAGGAWLPNGPRSYSGNCLRTPRTMPPPVPVPPDPRGPAP